MTDRCVKLNISEMHQMCTCNYSYTENDKFSDMLYQIACHAHLVTYHVILCKMKVGSQPSVGEAICCANHDKE